MRNFEIKERKNLWEFIPEVEKLKVEKIYDYDKHYCYGKYKEIKYIILPQEWVEEVVINKVEDFPPLNHEMWGHWKFSPYKKDFEFYFKEYREKFQDKVAEILAKIALIEGFQLPKEVYELNGYNEIGAKPKDRVYHYEKSRSEYKATIRLGLYGELTKGEVTRYYKVKAPCSVKIVDKWSGKDWTLYYPKAGD